MKKQVIHVSPQPFSKVVALFVALLMSPGIPIGVLILIFGGKSRFNGLFFIFVPLGYVGIYYLLSFLSALLYNFVASRFGGIEVTVIDVDEHNG